MSFLKGIQKMVKPHHLLILLGIIVIIIALYHYSDNKSKTFSGLSNIDSSSSSSLSNSPTSTVKNSSFQGVESLMPDNAMNLNSQSNIKAPSCSSMPTLDPSELLPKDTNELWSSSNPPVSGGMGSMNFLNASAQLQSINTIGSSLRNANLQVRSEPPNPQQKVSPWLNSTIEPDLTRVPFEIGCSAPSKQTTNN